MLRWEEAVEWDVCDAVEWVLRFEEEEEERLLWSEEFSDVLRRGSVEWGPGP